MLQYKLRSIILYALPLPYCSATHDIMQHFIELTTLFAVMILQVIIPPIPAEGIVIIAARKYGILTTTAVSGAGLIAGSMAVYGIGRYLKSAFARFFDRGKVALILEQIRKHGSAILWIRILPYNPSDIISYTAGIAAIPSAKFITITVIAAPIRCAMLAAMGRSISSYGTLVLVAALLLLSAILAHVIVYSRHRRKNARK